MVIDSDMDIFPSGTMDAAPPIAGDATADGLEATDFLDVEVEQIAGQRVFVANHGRRGFEIAHAAEVESAQNAADGGATEAGGEGDPNAGPTLAAESFDPNHQVGVAAARGMLRARRTIAETAAAFALVTTYPLGSGLGAASQVRFARAPLD